jgi:hypothetical protein
VILLDTDHFTVLKYTDSERYERLNFEKVPGLRFENWLE